MGKRSTWLITGKFMTQTNQTTITKIQLWTLNIPITDPFVVATGQLTTAQNIFIQVTLRDGSIGFGEIAPFTDLTGETVSDSLKTAESLVTPLLGTPAINYRKAAQQFQDQIPNFPATRCGIETALLDASCQSANIPLWTLWGSADVRERETDITIPICDHERTLVLANEWHAKGFRLFKIKVGHDVDKDICRIESIHKQLPDVKYLVDPNQGFDRNSVEEFLKGINKIKAKIEVLEQPLPKDDLEGSAWLRQTFHIPIAADETVRTVADAQRVIQNKAADYINLKITKSGVIETLDILALTRKAGLKLIIGGMMETRIAMGCSFSIALGMGKIDYLDLDTPLLMNHDPITGGFAYRGPWLQPWKGAGLSAYLAPNDNSLVIE